MSQLRFESETCTLRIRSVSHSNTMFVYKILLEVSKMLTVQSTSNLFGICEFLFLLVRRCLEQSVLKLTSGGYSLKLTSGGYSRGNIKKPVTVAERSKACTVFARSEAGIVGSNPTQGMDV
jgi:hypothetical protein